MKDPLHEFATEAGLGDLDALDEGLYESLDKYSERIIRQCVEIAIRRYAYEVVDDILEFFELE